MPSLSFSDSESTGTGSTTSEQNEDNVPHHMSHDDQWLHELIHELDMYMAGAPQHVTRKWTALRSLTKVYYSGLKDTQAELDQETHKLSFANEALLNANAQVEELKVKLQDMTTDRDALETFREQLHEMMLRELDKWEMIAKEDT